MGGFGCVCGGGGVRGGGGSALEVHGKVVPSSTMGVRVCVCRGEKERGGGGGRKCHGRVPAASQLPPSPQPAPTHSQACSWGRVERGVAVRRGRGVDGRPGSIAG